MKKIDALAFLLVLIGGITWGIWGFFQVNIIDYVFGKLWIDQVVYILIGISSVYLAIYSKSIFGKISRKPKH